MSINFPAYLDSTLRIGRTYDARISSAGIDIFPPNIPTTETNVNRYTFTFKEVKNSSDVRDLLDISGSFSLKVKAGILKVEGSGKYLNDRKRTEGTTEVLAVLKCVTISETIDGLPDVADAVASGQVKYGLGTHYVRDVIYGAEMVVSLSIKSSISSERTDIEGGGGGPLLKGVAVGASLKAKFEKLARNSSDLSDIDIKYYATTDLPDKLPTTLDDLVEFIDQFPSRLEKVNNGQGIPLQFVLLPINFALQTAEPPFMLPKGIENRMEQYFDDLCTAQSLVEEYKHSMKVDEDDDTVSDFEMELTQVKYEFEDAIPVMASSGGKDQVDACLESYQTALLGEKQLVGKFCKKWEKIMKDKKAAPTTSIKLPPGDPLTVVLLGKTGNGKSATGNTIVGIKCFQESPSASSATRKCGFDKRNDERVVCVIDTPGIMDTFPLTRIAKFKEKAKDFTGLFKETQEEILREVAKIFLLAPDGFDAIILTVKYGVRLDWHDTEALKILLTFLEEVAKRYMILLFTNGDEAKRTGEDLKGYLEGLPDCVKEFIEEIEHRTILFDNTLMDPPSRPDENMKQLSRLIQMIDNIRNKEGGSFMHRLNTASEKILDESIKEAMATSGLTQQRDELTRRDEELAESQRQLEEKENEKEKEKANKEKGKLEKEKAKNEEEMKELQEGVRKQHTDDAQTDSGLLNSFKKKIGGCYPGSAIVTDKHGRRRQMKFLQLGEEVEVITKNGIQLEPVITFIHRQPEVTQEFLKITTTENNILKITEDHLLFVEKMGQAAAIPARDVKVGDTVFVRGKHGIEKDAVQSISTVYEKGVYAPVTLSGTILVNNVHTSCYFDVLSHEWSHRAMGVARAVHYVSPWMLQWISGVGQKDGFPGWCRLAHKMLTLLD